MKNNTAPPPPIAPTIPRMVELLLVEATVSGFEIYNYQILIT